MIPKILHYCWFGKEDLPPLSKECINSWEIYLHDFKLYKWDESNLETNSPVVIDALNNKMWAFAADYIRLYVLYKYGGIYLDTDMEVIRPFDQKILDCHCFFGKESKDIISAGIIGAEPRNQFILQCLGDMERLYSIGVKYISIPKIITSTFHSVDEILKPVVYEPVFFYPYNPYDNSRDIRQLMYKDIKKDTYAIHHWMKKWKVGFWNAAKNKLINIWKMAS